MGWYVFFTMEYRGERIHLSYPRFDQDAFENAERKLSAQQAARVEQLLLAAKLEPGYETLSATLAAVHELVVPGYGSRGFARVAPNGERYILSCVEIPETGRDRCFLFAQSPAGLRLRDDVVVDSRVSGFDPLLASVVYFDQSGRPLPLHYRFGIGQGEKK